MGFSIEFHKINELGHNNSFNQILYIEKNSLTFISWWVLFWKGLQSDPLRTNLITKRVI